MAGERRVPNYRKLYPAASEEVIAVLRQSERKMQYQEYDLKTEKFAGNKDKQKAFFIPGREDSLERLIEADIQFRDENTNVEEAAIRVAMINKLRESLKLLNSADYELIIELFYKGKSEREYAEQCGVSRTTLQYRKYRILENLKNIL